MGGLLLAFEFVTDPGCAADIDPDDQPIYGAKHC